MQTTTLPIRDIKDIVQVPDYSLYVLIALGVLALSLFMVLMYLLFRFWKNRQKNPRKIWYNSLKNIDYSESKKAAYDISWLVRALAKNEREKRLAHELIQDLWVYKYKKEVPAISKNTRFKVSTFLDVIDV